jgi:hypothetical protein
MCRRTDALLQSITVFSLVLGIEKEFLENRHPAQVLPHEKKCTTLPSTQLSIRHVQAPVLARPYTACMFPR